MTKVSGVAVFSVEVPFNVTTDSGEYEGWTQDDVDNELYAMTGQIEDEFPILLDWMNGSIKAEYHGSEFKEAADER